MTQPMTWDDVQALIGTNETPHLDFKRQPPEQGHEIRKQIAGMAKDGGKIVYGLAEDKARRVGAEITPAPVDGLEERISSAGRNITPPLRFKVDVVKASVEDTEGVAIVDVPASSDWPHMVNGRYVTRDGTSTRWMTHDEVQIAFAAKARSAGQIPPSMPPEPVPKPLPAPPERTADLFGDYVSKLPGIDVSRVRATFEGHAVIRVAVRPATGRFEHPDGVWLGPAFARAHQRARDAVAAAIPKGFSPRFLDLADELQADGTDHWVAGYAGGDVHTLAQHQRGSAVLDLRLGHLLMESTRPTAIPEQGGEFSYYCAYEPWVAAEVWAMLRFAGEFFSGVPSAQDLHAALHLAGFADCYAHASTRAEDRVNPSHLPTAPPYLMRSVATTSADLVNDRSSVPSRLLDSWLPAFYEDRTPLWDKVLVTSPLQTAASG